MRNSFIIFFLSFCLNTYSLAENIFIEAKNISLDKNKETTIFEKDVIVKTETGDVIKSEFAEYNRSSGLIKLRKKLLLLMINRIKLKLIMPSTMIKQKYLKL